MAQRNEGEGNKTAAREYHRRATAHAKTGRARKSARKAAAAIDAPTAMRKAEIKGKAEARGEVPKLHKKGVPGPKPDSDLD